MRKGVLSKKRSQRLKRMIDVINKSEVELDYKDLSEIFEVSPSQASIDLKDLLSHKKVDKKKVWYGNSFDELL